MKYLKYILPLLLLTVMACNSSRSGKSPRTPKREVPIAINIDAENSRTINFINLDYFRLQLIQDLDQFQEVNFLLVDPSENPEVVLNLNISSFTLWPRDERMARRRVSRNIAVGTDAAGKPIYQTVTATVDIVEIQRRSNARFEASLLIKGTPGLKFQRTFVPRYNYVDTYVNSVQGDTRAIDPRLMTRGINIEPVESDFLLLLARQEMIRRLSSELRNYYDAPTEPAKK
ncbi:MAG: hypothetical protein WBJ10_10265 [Daejeonella sp.]|uniref:hypothetical protein n=1 Tax=Daejeonella sp. TaxID=2805397 RepID=UPI003C739C51